MNKKVFRAKLYQTYITSGIQDHAVIQGHIKAAEAFVFDNSQIAVSEFSLPNNKISTSENPSIGSRALKNNEHLANMIEEDRATAKAALKLIYQRQFATVDELIQQMARLAYGDVCLTIDPLENLTEAGKISREKGDNSSRSSSRK